MRVGPSLVRGTRWLDVRPWGSRRFSSRSTSRPAAPPAAVMSPAAASRRRARRARAARDPAAPADPAGTVATGETAGAEAKTTASNTRRGARTTRRSPVSTPRSPSPPARTCAARRWPTRRRRRVLGRCRGRVQHYPRRHEWAGTSSVPSPRMGERVPDCLNAELAAMIERALRWYADNPAASRRRLRRDLGRLAMPGPHLRRGGASR